MNSFGLGLVLNFVDNASSGMANASRSFQQLGIAADSVSSTFSASVNDILVSSYALDRVGTTLMNVGSSILGVYSDISQSVIDSGMEMQGYRMQMNALYGSVEAGEAKINEIKDYAMSSVFEIQSLIPAVTMMKAVGIEAMDEVTTSSGNATQKLLDYAADLAAMMPNMRNTYGTGVKAAMGAFKEYIAEGNALSLKRGAGLDITQILGEDKGASIEERTQQVADLIEKLNIVGYTANLAGTPMQRMSNMQDALFNTLTKIADSGVFEVYCGLLEKLSEWVFALVEDEETFNTITGVLADTITTLLAPLNSLLDFLIANGNAIINWIKEHPKLTKIILLSVAAIGAFLVVGGAFLKLVSSIGMASAGLSFLKTMPSILSLVGGAFKGLITKALPFVALAALMYWAWSENLFGIRDAITSVLSDLGATFSLISAAWNDNTLSEEEFVKAKDLGILPLISALLQLKYYWDFFVTGFKEGFSAFFNKLSETLNELGILDVDIKTIVSSIGEFLQGLIEIGAEDKWTSVGKNLGEIAGALTTIAVVFFALKGAISVISGIVKAFGVVFKVIAFILKPIGWIITGIKGIWKVLKVIIDGVKWLWNFLSSTVGAVFMVIVGVIMAIVGFVKQLIDGFSWVWEIIKWIGIALAVVGAILLGVSALPAVIVGAIVGLVTLLIVLIKDYWNEICAFFSKIGSWIYDNVIKPVADFFVWLWNGIVDGVMWVVNGIVSFFTTIATWIYDNVISPIVDFFVNIIFPIISKIVEIIMKIIEIIVVLVTVFVKWIYNNVIKPIAKFFAWLWNTIVDAVTSFIKTVKSIINTIVGWIDENIITPIADFFTALWNGIVDAVTAFIDTVKSIFITIVSWIDENIIQPVAEFFATLWEGIVTAFNVVADTVTGVLKGAINAVLSFICGIINGVISAINAAISVINAIPGVSISKITKLEVPQLAQGGIVDGPTTAVIGEAGTEAVIPLENNTGGLELIADKLANRISNNQGSSSVTNEKQEVHNDYSVTFAAGSVVVQLANATDAELEKAAEKLMKIIERKQQLKSMAVRA